MNMAAKSHMRARICAIAGVSFLLCGCISASDTQIFAPSQGFAPNIPDIAADSTLPQSIEDLIADDVASAAAVPVASPDRVDVALQTPAIATEPAQSIVLTSTGVDALNHSITQTGVARPTANLFASTPAAASPSDAAAVSALSGAPEASANSEIIASDASTSKVSAGEPVQADTPQVQELAVVAPPKKKSIFSRLFASPANANRTAPPGTSKRIVRSQPERVVVASALSSGGNDPPGAKPSIEPRLGPTDRASGSNGSNGIELASAAGLARLAPNGLRIQTDRVKVDCFKPELVRVLKSVERHYGLPVVVTSGYRSPRHNRRIGGASGSRHTSCEAADIQIEGVSKWQLAKYLRTMPNRGGVGTYCHTDSVHIDIGNTRDWNWRCRRRR